MKPFSFVHVADLHLGYAQYNLDVRRQDFDNAFKEVVDETLELKPSFNLIKKRHLNHCLFRVSITFRSISCTVFSNTL